MTKSYDAAVSGLDKNQLKSDLKSVNHELTALQFLSADQEVQETGYVMQDVIEDLLIVIQDDMQTLSGLVT